ncbi:murein biosynthesis integral membrane protein MurJ [Acidobacteria bacterium AH-259-D05]|nr:murein biosynthesis integral membrane protein MurJ [Acidobacteria bacterium AH-259-D05]
MAQPVQSARAVGKVSLAVFLSRILGLVRDQVFAKLFGAGLYNDAWLVAFRIPNLFRDLFAEGALSAAFVPTFTEFLHKKGIQQAWVLANLILSGLLVLLGGFALVLPMVSRLFVYLLAAGFAEVPGKVEITANLLKILSPFLMLVAMASVGMAILNTLNHFFLPALAPALFNVAVILSGLFLAPQFERWEILPIYAMGVGALLGGLLQCAIQLPLMRRHGYRFRFHLDLGHEGVRRIARLIAPAIVGVGAVQINVLINTQIASFLQENGPVSWLSYAFRIIYLPIGLFGVSVGVVNLREVSILAAQENWEELRETVANSIKLVSIMAVPSSVGLMVLAIPIVDVIFERGGFTPNDTLFTAYAVMGYSLGLFAYSCMKVYVPTFYALNDTRTPVRISMIAVFTNLVINLILVFWILPQEYRYVGLALGTALSVTLSHILLAKSFRQKLGSLQGYEVISTFSKTVVAAGVMGLIVYFLNRFFQEWWGEMNSWQELMALTGSILVGAVVYFGCCWLMRIQEIRYLFNRLKG